MRKNIIIILTVLVSLSTIVACNDYETYADQKKKESNGISDFISTRGINVIDENTFRAQGNTTKLEANQYVYLNNSGVYLQIVRKGAGKPLQNKETTDLQIRFVEQSIFDTTNVISNYYDTYDPDVMTINRTGTTYTASFTSGLMYSYYSASVPSGWLVPFNYINLGYADSTGNIAKVRLIVPHTQGHTTASSNVYPYYYEISFQRSPNS